MTYRMTARVPDEIVVVCQDPPMQFRLRCSERGPGGPVPPALLRVKRDPDEDVLLICINSDFGGGERWHYKVATERTVRMPAPWIMEGRAPNAAELDAMDPAERADWETRMQDTPSLPQQPLPSEY